MVILSLSTRRVSGTGTMSFYVDDKRTVLEAHYWLLIFAYIYIRRGNNVSTIRPMVYSIKRNLGQVGKFKPTQRFSITINVKN